MKMEVIGTGLTELLLTAIGLAMDAFAVSICQGLGMRKMKYGQALMIGLYFGAFQALMPLLGWLLGISFSQYIQAFDHWIAFILLAIIGGKMLWDAFHEEKENVDVSDKKPNQKELFLLAIATSIDALAVGVAFACLEMSIVRSTAIIGVVTFCICVVGVFIGHRFGNRFQKYAGMLGGIILILIAGKILIEHLIEKI